MTRGKIALAMLIIVLLGAVASVSHDTLKCAARTCSEGKKAMRLSGHCVCMEVPSEPAE